MKLHLVLVQGSLGTGRDRGSHPLPGYGPELNLLLHVVAQTLSWRLLTLTHSKQTAKTKVSFHALHRRYAARSAGNDMTVPSCNEDQELYTRNPGIAFIME